MGDFPVGARTHVLTHRIRVELTELERTVTAVKRDWHRLETVPEEREAYLNSVALNLHSFYTGLERILELIVQEVDGGALGGEAWHRELLRQAALDLTDIRPPVLSREVCEILDEYRKFRHRVRHIYAMYLAPERMAGLVHNLPSVWEQVQKELGTFADFLERSVQEI
ncbi:MAG: hypothetical protein B1H02_04165 [Candidatus Latescibacteria bacterium 4484_107]|nr:MAG: hypothetical protein B1H02_04165 [Candidatus Latescibacteria bacterium 4484_107]